MSWGAAGHADVFSVNVYDSQVRPRQVPADVDMPIIASEFHFGAVDRGVPSPGLPGSWDQRQGGFAFDNYLASALAEPRFVGVHRFQWIDQSGAGRQDRENHQLGFVDVTGRAYPEFVEIVSRATKAMYPARTDGQSSTVQILEALVTGELRKAPLKSPTEIAAGEAWRDQFFGKHPKADSSGDRFLSWPEYKKYRKELDSESPPEESKHSAETDQDD